MTFLLCKLQLPPTKDERGQHNVQIHVSCYTLRTHIHMSLSTLPFSYRLHHLLLLLHLLFLKSISFIFVFFIICLFVIFSLLSFCIVLLQVYNVFKYSDELHIFLATKKCRFFIWRIRAISRVVSCRVDTGTVAGSDESE